MYTTVISRYLTYFILLERVPWNLDSNISADSFYENLGVSFEHDPFV